MKRPFGILLAVCVAVALPGTAEAVPVPGSAPGNVAVLVVDDFGLGRDGGEKTGGMSDNCTVGASDVGSNGAGDDLPASGYSHGELVHQVLRDSLTAALGVPPAADVWSMPSYAVRLEAVHVSGYRTADVIAGIRSRIDALRRAKYERFVVNLSFVVVPCDVIGWLGAGDLDALLTTYDSMIRNDPTSALKAALQGYLDPSGALDPSLVRDGTFTLTVLRTPDLSPLRPYLVGAFYKTINVERFSVKDQRPLATVHNDPAWSDFREQYVDPGTAGAALKVIPVGASGNGVKFLDSKGNLVRKGLPFPFAPALWDFVVSAGADDATDRFNAAEVTLNGSGPSVVPGSFGTSFAAPRLSALEARYLAETGNVTCGGAPPLGYVDLTATPVLNLSTGSPWKNQPRPAWPAICGTFPS
jgi:hypothetical protein